MRNKCSEKKEYWKVTAKHDDQKMKMKFFGHTYRHDSIMKNILEGHMEGSRPQGRPGVHWCDNIKEWLGHRLS